MPFNAGGPVTDYKDDVGQGWHGLLDQLHEELVQAEPNYQTIQVKEKFGDLRVYLNSMGDSSVWDIISKYERLSSTICEECGQPGKHDTAHHWIKTLCEGCASTREERRQALWRERSDGD